MTLRLVAGCGLLAVSLAFSGCGREKDRPASPNPGPAPAAVAPTANKQLREFPDLGGDLNLTDHHGEPFVLGDTHGQVRLLFFGYASCPDICPQTLSKIVRVRRILGRAADELTTIFVSVDPQRDSPERLAEYLGYFDLGNAVALTGSAAEIDAALESFSARFEKVDRGSAVGYLIDHTSFIYLIDQKGKVRAVFRHGEQPEEIATAARLLTAPELG